MYDGFISYSHAADDLLAPRLQAGLQRFAKPWWKRRAVRIFRDESSLAANPHLWSSITEALEDSDWFVLLLSEDAAASEWVGKEIEHWVANKDPEKILPVVTGGEFGWDSGHVTGSSVPPALHGVFSEEPRWVDLRFARGEELLDLKNPAFSNAVADVASAIRGVPKDELASEEVRQHRRTVRTAWAVGVLVAVLGMTAVVFGIQAGQQRNLAEANAEAEAEARAEADANAAAETEARQQAEINAQLAKARELAASAVSILDLDPELATLLSVAAIDASPDGEALPLEVENALWRAGSTNRLIDVFETGHAGLLDLSPDGTQVVVTTADQELSVLDAFSGEVIWTYSEETVDHFASSAWGPDGRIVLAIIDSSSLSVPNVTTQKDDLSNRLAVLDGSDGSLLHSIPIEYCTGADLPVWSPDGNHLAISNGEFGCPRVVDGDVTNNWLEVFDTTTWESLAVLPVDGDREGAIPRYDQTGTLHALIPFNEIATFESGTYLPLPRTGAMGIGDVSSGGSRYFLFYSNEGPGGTAFSAVSVDVATGQRDDVIYTGYAYPSTPAGVEVTPDDQYVVVGTVGAFTHVYDASTGYELHRLPTTDLFSSAFDPVSERLYTTAADTGVRVWDLQQTAVGVQATGDLGPFTWINGTGFSLGPAIGGMETIDFANGQWANQFFDLRTGRLIGEPFTDTAGPQALSNGKFVVFDFLTETVLLQDLESGEAIELLPCDVVGEVDGEKACIGPNEPMWYDVGVSIDGSEILAFGNKLAADGRWVFSGHYRELDSETGEVVYAVDPDEALDVFPPSVDPGEIDTVAEEWVYAGGVEGYGIYDLVTGELLFAEPQFTSARIELSADGHFLAFRGGTEVVITDTESWEAVATASFPTRIRGASFNSDGSRLAVGTIDSLLVIDTSTGLITRQLRLPGTSDAYWMDNETLLVGTNRGVFGTVSLSSDAFLEDVRSDLRRGFTEQECALYQLDSCPTLDDLREG